jgi:hypothetical protein
MIGLKRGQGCGSVRGHWGYMAVYYPEPNLMNSSSKGYFSRLKTFPIHKYAEMHLQPADSS